MEKFEKVANQCKLYGCRNPASSNGYYFRHISHGEVTEEEKDKPTKAKKPKKDDKE